MGINVGAFIAPILTGWLAEQVFGTADMPAYKIVFIAAGIGMLVSLVWFWFGRAQLQGHRRRQPARRQTDARADVAGRRAASAIPVIYFLLRSWAPTALQCVLIGAVRRAWRSCCWSKASANGAVARDKVIAMLIIFAFNILFWMFFEQAGSSFTFLADKIVNRDLGGWIFPTALVPDGQLDRDHRAGADHRLDLGRAGPRTIRRSRASSASA